MLLLCSQPSSARPWWRPYGRAYGECCKSGRFWRFETSRGTVSCGRRGTSWHSNMFHNAPKVVLRDRRNTLARFAKDKLHFPGRRSTLDMSMVILRGRRSTLDVSCCVFFGESHCPRSQLVGVLAVAVAGVQEKPWPAPDPTVSHPFHPGHPHAPAPAIGSEVAPTAPLLWTGATGLPPTYCLGTRPPW